MTTHKKKALSLLSDKAFLRHFQPQKLDEYDIESWQPDMGPKHALHLLPPAQIDFIFVDNALKYTTDNLACWFAALKVGGVLALESNRHDTYDGIAGAIESLAVKIPNNNCHVWLFAKIPSAQNYPQYYQTVSALLDEGKVAEVFKHSRLIDLQYPHSFFSTYIQAKLLYGMGMLEEMEKVWDRFIARAPNAQNHFFRILDQISTGNYYEGFKARSKARIPHERRTRCVPPKEIETKEWKGEPLMNKTLVIWSEFGLGDEIMFTQLAYYLRSLGTKKIIAVAQPPIVSLLATHPDLNQVISTEEIDTLGEFDYWVYPHDILAYIPTPFAQLPKRSPYLFPAPADVAKHQHSFKPTKNLKVGIVWRGNSTHENDIYRSIHDLSYIRKLFELEQVDWYCFQKACNEAEKALLNEFNVPNITEHFSSMYDTAAALQHVDCLVTVDTSVTHIAGATGVKTLLLLPFFVDWRWGQFQTDNMWYPNMLSFRNYAPVSSWGKAFDQITEHLKLMYRLKNQFNG